MIRSITFAYAYPTGPSVSMGSNPLVVINGTKTSGVIHTVPSDKILVVKDIYIRNNSSYSPTFTISSDVIGKLLVEKFENDSRVNNNSKLFSYSSGIRIEQNTELSISSNTNTSFDYLITGYYAHP